MIRFATIGVVLAGCSSSVSGAPGEALYGLDHRGHDTICDEWEQSTATCRIGPSGDATGVIDADRIEAGLELVRDHAGGATLLLSDGDITTHDTYYTSRNVVVEYFTGTLSGESLDSTTWHAGRKSATEGFQPALSPVWTNPIFSDTLPPTILQLDFATGDVRIENLAIAVTEQDPSDPFPLYWDPENQTDTSIWTAIELLGFSGRGHDTVVENVRITGPEPQSSTQGLGYGIHSMPWVRPFDEEGNFHTWPPERSDSSLTVIDSSIEGLPHTAILAMDMAGSGAITVRDVDISNTGVGLVFARHSIPVALSDLDIATWDGGWGVGINLVALPGGTIRDVAFHNPDATSLRLRWVSGLTTQDIRYPDGGSACDYVDEYPEGSNSIEGLDTCP